MKSLKLMFIALTLGFSSEVRAEQVIQLAANLKGKITHTEVVTAQTSLVQFLAITSGNSTQPFSVALSGPPGLKLSAKMGTLNRSVTEILESQRAFWPIPLFSSKDMEARSKSCVTFSPGEIATELPDIPRPESNSPLCDLFSEDDMRAIAESLALLYGGEWSRSQVCGYIVENYFGGAEPCDPEDLECIELTEGEAQAARLSTPRLSSLNRLGVLRKDACVPKKTKYLVVFSVDLTQVDTKLFPSATISLQAIEYRYSGEKASSIKPVSDGKYAPQPLALMTFLGTMCGQELQIVKWSKRKPRAIQPVLVGDLIPYRGRILNRSPLGGLLTGGKGSFDLSSPTSGYGVCFDLVPRRQRVHGY